MKKYCWTTLLATDDYVWGILGLYFSLQKVYSKYPLIPIVTDNISDETKFFLFANQKENKLEKNSIIQIFDSNFIK